MVVLCVGVVTVWLPHMPRAWHTPKEGRVSHTSSGPWGAPDHSAPTPNDRPPSRANFKAVLGLDVGCIIAGG